MVDEALIRSVTARIVEHFQPRRVILFGSHARGDAHPDSDLDLLIEMESDLPPVERAVEVMRLFRNRKWPLDLFVYTPDEVARDRDRLGTLIDLVETEGKVLYSND